MLDKIQLTLYEIFGYFLPGTMAALSLLLIYWAFCLPHVAFPIYKIHPDAMGWASIIGISYLLGHINQGIGNRYLTGAEARALGPKGTIASDIRITAQKRAAELMGVRADCIDPSSLFRFADEYALQKGQLGDRDVFVYREGFYKGCTISLSMLGIALILRAIAADTAIKMPDYIYYISRTQIFTASIVIFFAAAISRQRFQRFGAYRVTRAIFAFLAVTGPDSSAQNGAQNA
jgi:hypothetical protein